MPFRWQTLDGGFVFFSEIYIISRFSLFSQFS